MIIDCFTFFNELELLDIRLNYLNPIVDQFILVEATTTHSGQPKPLYFNDNKDKFKPFLSKIRHIIVNDMPPVLNNDRWKLENYQRNAILIGLYDMQDDDYIMIGDVDEIPNIEQVAKKPFGTYNQKAFMYYLNTSSGDNWTGTVGMTYNKFITTFRTPQEVRNKRNFLEPIRNGGWHFAWLGGYERVYQKIKAFAHTEVDIPAYMDKLEESVRITRPLWCPDSGPLPIVPIDDTYPEYIVDNMDLLKDLIYDNQRKE